MQMMAGVNAATKDVGVKMLLLTASLSLAIVLITGGKAFATKPESFARLALEACFEGRPDAAGIKQRLVGLNWRESTTARQKAIFLTGMSSAEGKQVALFRTNHVSGRDFVSCAIDTSGPAPVEVAAEVARALRITMKVDDKDKSNPMYFYFGDFVPQDHLYHLLSIAVAKSNSPTQLGLPKGSQTTTVRISYPVPPLMN